MGASLLVIALVPPETFAPFLEELRQRYPEAGLTALVGTPELEVGEGAARPEYLRWGAGGSRALLRELRRRHFDLLVLAYTKDYCHRLTFWKALALVAASGAKGLLFCEEARLPAVAAPVSRLARPLPRAGALLSAVVCRGLWRVLGWLLTELLILVLGAGLLLVLLAITVVDGADALLGLVTRRQRKALTGRGS